MDFYRGKVPYKELTGDIIINSAIGAMSVATIAGLAYSAFSS